MAKTFTEEKQVHVSTARLPGFSLKLYRRMRSLFTPTEPDSRPELPSPIEQHRTLVSDIHRTADSLDQIEQLLLRKLGLEQNTDRATDQLICKLRIETNRLKAQISELLEK